MEQETFLKNYASLQSASYLYKSKIETRNSRIATLGTTLRNMKSRLEIAQQQATEAAKRDGGQGAADATAEFEAKILEQNVSIHELEMNLESKVNELAALVLSSKKKLDSEYKKFKDRGLPDQITKKWLEGELQIKYSAEKKAAARRRHVFIEKGEHTYLSKELKTANEQTELSKTTVSELEGEIKTLAEAHTTLGKAHDELVERLAEKKEDKETLVAKQVEVVAGLKDNVKILNESGQAMETRIRQLQQEVRLAKLDVGGKENSLVLANSMGNNVVMGGLGMGPATPQQGNDNASMFGSQQSFGFSTPQAGSQQSFGFSTPQANFGNMMGAQQHHQQQKQNTKGNSATMAMFQQYLKFQQQMAQQVTTFQ